MPPVEPMPPGSEVAPESRRAPLETVAVPVKVLAPERASTPEPVTFSRPEPETTPESVIVRGTARTLSVVFTVTPVVASVRTAFWAPVQSAEAPSVPAPRFNVLAVLAVIPPEPMLSRPPLSE